MDSYLTFATATHETFKIVCHKGKQNISNAILEVSTLDNMDSELKTISVELLETDTVEQVAKKSKIAIKSILFSCMRYYQNLG